jgi:hypothetical protein
LLYSWNYFNSHNRTIQSLYTFGLPQTEKNDDPKTKAASIVADRQAYRYWYYRWFCLACCGGERKRMWDEALEKKIFEFDLVQLIYATRKANFLSKLQDNPD